MASWIFLNANSVVTVATFVVLTEMSQVERMPQTIMPFGPDGGKKIKPLLEELGYGGKKIQSSLEELGINTKWYLIAK